MDKNVELLSYERADSFFTRANNYVAYNVPKDESSSLQSHNPGFGRSRSIPNSDPGSVSRSNSDQSNASYVCESRRNLSMDFESSDEEEDYFIPNKPMTFPNYSGTPPLVDDNWVGKKLPTNQSHHHGVSIDNASVEPVIMDTKPVDYKSVGNNNGNAVGPSIAQQTVATLASMATSKPEVTSSRDVPRYVDYDERYEEFALNNPEYTTGNLLGNQSDIDFEEEWVISEQELSIISAENAIYDANADANTKVMISHNTETASNRIAKDVNGNGEIVSVTHQNEKTKTDFSAQDSATSTKSESSDEDIFLPPPPLPKTPPPQPLTHPLYRPHHATDNGFDSLLSPAHSHAIDHNVLINDGLDVHHPDFNHDLSSHYGHHDNNTRYVNKGSNEEKRDSERHVYHGKMKENSDVGSCRTHSDAGSCRTNSYVGSCRTKSDVGSSRTSSEQGSGSFRASMKKKLRWQDGGESGGSEKNLEKITNQVCHHVDCLDKNKRQPLMLCEACDQLAHADSNECSSHVRFEVFRKDNLNRNSSLRSLPDMSGSEEEEDEENSENRKSSKLKRRSATTKQRYHTADENGARKPSPRVPPHRSQSAQQLPGLPVMTTTDSEDDSDDEPSSAMLNVNTAAVTVPSEMGDNRAAIEMGDNRDFTEMGDNREFDVSPNAEGENEGNAKTSGHLRDICNSKEDLSSSQTTLTNGSEDSRVYMNQSNESLQQGNYNKSPLLSLDENTDEPLSNILQSSPFRADPDSAYEKNEYATPIRHEDIEVIYDEEADGIGRSKTYHLDNQSNSSSQKENQSVHHIQNESQSLSTSQSEPVLSPASKAESSQSGKQTTPTTPKTPPHASDLLKKYSMSKEYFILELDLLPEAGKCEIVAAQKGVNLRDAVRQCLERHGINVNHVNIYLDSSNTPLPIVADCFVLGGNHLHVKAKDNTEGSLGKSNRTASSSSLTTASKQARPTTLAKSSQKSKKSEDSGISSDVSPAGTFTSSDTAKFKKESKSRSIFSFSKGQQEKHDCLLQQLENYSTNGLPPMPALLDMGAPKYEDSLFEIESHWSALVGVKPTDLTKKQKDQQEAIWELVHTEIQYIRKLQVVINLFYCCLMDLQNEGILCEVRTEELFSNILEVSQVSQAFWVTHLRHLVEHSRSTRKLLDPSFLFEGFMRFDEIFHPYAKYCLEQKACLEYIKNNERDNELFRIFTQWAEAQKQCKRLKLQDLVIAPMQRLTKYKLLLIAILKKTERESHRKHLKHTIEKVDKFVLQVNTVMHQRDEHERLSIIIDRIESYDVIDSTNDEVQKLMGDFCKLDLTCPVPGCGPQQRRHLLLEGGLRLRDSGTRMDVYCFLFTDMLLITKPNKRGDKVKVTKPPMRLDKCVVNMLRDGVSFALLYLNEYHMATAVHTFHGEAAKVWVDHIRRAQESYKALRKIALEQSENRMYWEMFYEENYEDELAVINNTPGSANRGAHAERQESSVSLDHYHGPSHHTHPDAMHRSTSQGVLRYGGGVGSSGQQFDIRGMKNSASLDENAMQHQISATRENVQRSDSEPSRPSKFSLPRQQNEHHYSDSSQSNSPASVRTMLNGDQQQQQRHMSKKLRNRYEARRTDSQSSGDVPMSPPGGVSGGMALSSRGSGSRYKTLPHTGPSTADEQQQDSRNGRLNPRRNSRGDKRYYTADAIEDIRNKDNAPRADASIQKRRSWNLGTVDISINDENRSHYLSSKNKTISSDSLRSMPSSSGVSSTGSLHLSPESEIYEEYEEDDDDEPQMALLNNAAAGSMTSQRLPSGTHQKLHFLDSQHSDGSSTNESSVTLTEHLDQNEFDSDSSDNQTRTKNSQQNKNTSASEAASGGSTETLRGGNAAGQSGEKKKLSHGELVRMQKQLLLNSTLEASEV